MQIPSSATETMHSLHLAIVIHGEDTHGRVHELHRLLGHGKCVVQYECPVGSAGTAQIAIGHVILCPSGPSRPVGPGTSLLGASAPRQDIPLHESEGLLTAASMIHEVDECTPTALPTWKPVVSGLDVSCLFCYMVVTFRPVLQDPCRRPAQSSLRRRGCRRGES